MEEIEWLRKAYEKQQEEIGRLRQENARLSALVEELLPLRSHVEGQRQQIEALERDKEELRREKQACEDKLSKDSHNSSLPPSSDRFSRKKRNLRKKSGKKAGGQPGHEGKTLCKEEKPDEVFTEKVVQCQHCHADLQTEPVLRVESRQQWDIPPKRMVVREYRAEEKYCPHCQHVSRAAFPEGINAPVQYGPGIAAVGVYLVQYQLLPYERACEAMTDLLGASVTVGTLKSMIERCAKNLQEVESRIKEYLRRVGVRHQDETGLYVGGKRWWMHVTSTQTVTHYGVHPQRGSQALDEIGLMEGFRGTSVHDGFGSYTRYQECKHAGCNVHVLRDLKFQEEQKSQAWAKKLAKVLLDMKDAVARARQAGESKLADEQRSALLKRYEEAIQEGYHANPADPPPKEPKKGRRAQSKARNLLDRLSKEREVVLRFLDDFSVPFDNNQAERDLRMVKVQQKISGCFRHAGGASAFARIRGYLSTLRKQSLPILSAIEMALLGSPLVPAL